MCTFLFAKNYISRELLSVLKRVNGNKFERTDDMNGYNYDAVEVGKRIRTIRKKNKVTQEQLAEKLFLTAESVSNFENGKTMCMPENIAKICELFGVTSDYIYYGIESASKVKNPLMDSIMAKLSGCSADELDRIDKMISLFLG